MDPQAQMLKRDRGTVRPRREQAQAAWLQVSDVDRHSDHPFVRGAYAAAEWTLQLTDRRPIAADLLSPDEMMRAVIDEDGRCNREATTEAIVAELELIVGIIRKQTPGNEQKARGAYAWLAWWVGVMELPGWLEEADTARSA